MKIYLATTAPGNEQSRKHNMHVIFHRLLSYYHIKMKQFECDAIFKAIKKYNKQKEI